MTGFAPSAIVRLPRARKRMCEELRKAGWKHVAEGGRDFCPKRKPRRRSRTTVVLVNSERKTERG